MASSSCSNGGMAFNVEALLPTVVTAVECCHAQQCSFEVWVSEGDYQAASATFRDCSR